jgi:enoyl-CoA hydratase/carnithine racemase
LTGLDITAEVADDLDLLVDVAKKGRTLESGRELANEIRDKPVLAVQSCKSLLDVTQSFEEYMQNALDRQWECINHPEHEEAVTAVNEGRDPEIQRDY